MNHLTVVRERVLQQIEPESFFPIFVVLVAVKNSHKLKFRTMLLRLQAEAVGREKPLAVLIFHAP